MSIPTGMAVLMKSMGVNPDELKASVETFMAGVKNSIQTVEDNQKRLEAKCDRILTMLDDLQKQGVIIDGQNVQLLEAMDKNFPLEPSIRVDSKSTKVTAIDGTDSGAIESEEKFPQEMLDAANAGLHVPNSDPYLQTK